MLRLHPVMIVREVLVRVLDLLRLQELLELLHHRVVHIKVARHGMGSQVVLAEVEESVVDQQRIFEVIALELSAIFSSGVMPPPP